MIVLREFAAERVAVVCVDLSVFSGMRRVDSLVNADSIIDAWFGGFEVEHVQGWISFSDAVTFDTS